MTLATPHATVPLFPLGTVLFPGGFLPLRIFEVRYLDLINRCHRSGEPFGVVGLTEGSEVRKAGAAPERFADVGTLATLRSFEVPHPGLMQIECVGAQRFRIRQRELQKHGLWTAEVDLLPDDLNVPVPEDLQAASDALARLLGALEERRSAEGAEHSRLPVLPPYRLDDCGWVANRWCELLPMQSELRQRLMQLDNPLMRLELAIDLLRRSGILA